MFTETQRLLKGWEALKGKILEEARSQVEATSYQLMPNATYRCQMVLRNGMVLEGYAPLSRGHDGKMAARKEVIAKIVLIEQYLAAERLYQEAQNAEKEP